jgi:hypothetical protein
MIRKVLLQKKVLKQLKKLPEKVTLLTQLLVEDLKDKGKNPGKHWPNFGKLKGSSNEFHCHLVKGRPTYLACWKLLSNSQRIFEVYYVGTHENAPY